MTFLFYFSTYLLITLQINICLVAGELLLDPNRVRYTQMSVDIEVSNFTLIAKHTDKPAAHWVRV